MSRDPKLGTIVNRNGLLVLLCLVILYATPAGASDFYVRTTGSNGNLGVSPETAFATIHRAAENARGGDSVIVGPGRHAEGDIKPDGSGRRDELVHFLADPTGALTGEPPGDVLVEAGGFGSGLRRSARSRAGGAGDPGATAGEDGM